jgi:O-antigen ligase
MIIRFRLRFDYPGSTWFVLGGSLLTALVIGAGVALVGGISQVFLFGVLSVTAIALLALRYQLLPFYLLVAILPLETVLAVEGLSTSLLIVPGGLAAFALLQQLSLGRTELGLGRQAVALALLLGMLATMSAMHAGGLTAVLAQARRYWLVIILFFLSQNLLREEQHLVKFGWLMAISLGLLGAYVFLDQAQSYLDVNSAWDVAQPHENRLDIGTRSGIAAMQLTKAIPFAFFLILSETKRRPSRRYVLGLCLALSVLGALATVSLNGFFGLGITGILIFLSVKRRTQRTRLALLGVALVGVALASPLGERLSDQQLALVKKDPIYWGTNRGLTWYTGLRAMGEEPLLGHGPGSEGVTEASLPYVPLDMLKRMADSGNMTFIPHNIFLSVGAELGVPGLVTFLILLAVVVIPLWRAVRRPGASFEGSQALYMGQAILIAIVALLAQGMALSVHLDKYLWLLLGAGVAFTRIYGIPDQEYVRQVNRSHHGDSSRPNTT